MRIFTLRTHPGLPRGVDWEDEFIIGRVLSVDPTPSAPRGALHFLSRDGKTKSRGALAGGFQCISFDDIVEVLGTPSPPRKTTAEIRAEEKMSAREVRRQERRKRARSRKR